MLIARHPSNSLFIAGRKSARADRRRGSSDAYAQEVCTRSRCGQDGRRHNRARQHGDRTGVCQKLHYVFQLGSTSPGASIGRKGLPVASGGLCHRGGKEPFRTFLGLAAETGLRPGGTMRLGS
jgi:hypothetical protein